MPSFTEEEIKAITQTLIDSYKDPRVHLFDTLVSRTLAIKEFRNKLQSEKDTISKQEILIFCFEQFQLSASVFGQVFNYHNQGSGHAICTEIFKRTKQLFNRVFHKQVIVESTGKHDTIMGLVLRKFPIEQSQLFGHIKDLHKKCKTEHRHKDVGLYELFSKYAIQVERLADIYANLVEPKFTPSYSQATSVQRSEQSTYSLFHQALTYFPSVGRIVSVDNTSTETAVESLDRNNTTEIETIRC